MGEVFGLDGKPALVVGGGSGIGRETAKLLAAVGARVAVADLDPDRADEVAKEVGGVAISGDVTDPAGAQRVVDEAHEALGGLAAVANIVGLAAWADLLSVDLATWEGDLRINLTQHLLVGRAVARHMIDDGTRGALAIVTSISGIYGAPNHSAYGAAKAGATNLARSMANEWAPYGIRVNSVAPDVIATPRVVAGFEGRGTDAGGMNAIVAEEALLGRWGRPEEIAGPLVFLLSDLAAFMTGQNLIVDGGSNARFPHAGPKPFSDD